VGAGTTDVFFVHFFVAVLTLFLTRELGFGPATLGFIFAIGGVSAFLGALIADRTIRRWGLGRSLIGGFLAYRLASFAIPLAAGPYAAQVAILSASQVLDAAATIQQISQNSLVQTTAPERLLGRVNASFQTLQQGAILLGLLIGGILGQTIGLRPTILVGLTTSLFSVIWLIRSPVSARPAATVETEVLEGMVG
jgi:predicted MFS family arabinose efflux permease